MSRLRALAVLAVALTAILAMWSGAARAAVGQADSSSSSSSDAAPPSSSLSSDTAPPDSSSSSSSSSSSDASSGPTSSTSTTLTIPPEGPPPPTTAPLVDPEAGGDAPAPPVPPVNVTIPPRTTDSTPAGQLAVPGRAVTVDVQGAQRLAQVSGERLALAHDLRTKLEGLLTQLQSLVGSYDRAGRSAVGRLTTARAALKKRAVDAYMRGTVDTSAPVTSLADLDHEQLEAALLGSVIARDDRAVAALKDAEAQASAAQLKVANLISSVTSELQLATAVEQQATLDAQNASVALAVTANGGDVVIEGFVFPVAKPYTFTDTYGAPRLPGTPYAHWHKGTDIAAAEGTPEFATERGVVTQILTGGLGGNGIWLVGESGTAYYYAHMSGFAPGLKAGAVVEAGQIVGYVGHTGDATGPHLHFEVHPHGGDAVNPYPILKAADTLESATTASPVAALAAPGP